MPQRAFVYREGNGHLQGKSQTCLDKRRFYSDVCQVNQTGDLASLSYLSHAQLELLSNLLTLRDALYSQEFRKFIRAVIGCGPLSGAKQDMSVNSYMKGCHLLNHDDVIGTRRVSYILYMPLPYGQEWKEEYGGALELYPVRLGADGDPEPEVAPSKAIPPSWNQFVFFEVQPGKSFHSVEEVVAGGKGQARLSISGWFHAAQEGEEDYVVESIPSEMKSSREQLVCLPCFVHRMVWLNVTTARRRVRPFLHRTQRHTKHHTPMHPCLRSISLSSQDSSTQYTCS